MRFMFYIMTPGVYDNEVFISHLNNRREAGMQDWGYAQANPDEQLARLYHFSMTKIEPGKEIPMVITVKEILHAQRSRAVVFRGSGPADQSEGRAVYSLWLGPDAARSFGRMRARGESIPVPGMSCV